MHRREKEVCICSAKSFIAEYVSDNWHQACQASMQKLSSQRWKRPQETDLYFSFNSIYRDRFWGKLTTMPLDIKPKPQWLRIEGICLGHKSIG